MNQSESAFAAQYGWQRYLPMVKNEMMLHVKRRIINDMISKLKKSEEGGITIRRRKAFYFANSGLIDHEGRHTIFGQVFQQCRVNNYDWFKKNNVDSKVFSVTF